MIYSQYKSIVFLCVKQYAECILFGAVFLIEWNGKERRKVEQIYEYLIKLSRTVFEPVRTIRETEKGRVELLRQKESGRLYLFRTFAGSADVYRKLVAVSCPYLPRVYEAAEEDGRTAVLEEYVRGDTLAELLKGGTLEPREVKRIATELAKALYVLHSFGAVHRDVKPENVILRGDEAVLVDFDASRVVKAEADVDTRVLGTMGFAAPEQYGLSQTDGRADIYALGVLMNVALTGTYPSKKAADGRLGRIIRKCTMAAPENRYRNVTELLEALS